MTLAAHVHQDSPENDATTRLTYVYRSHAFMVNALIAYTIMSAFVNLDGPAKIVTLISMNAWRIHVETMVPALIWSMATHAIASQALQAKTAK